MCRRVHEFEERLVRMFVCFLTIFSYTGIVSHTVGGELDLSRFGVMPSKYNRKREGMRELRRMQRNDLSLEQVI